jgi:hypothetical protein
MFWRKIIGKGVSFLAMSSMIFIQSSQVNMITNAATTLDVDATVVVSPFNAATINDGKFEGWGTSLCWWANRVGYSDTLSQKSAELFYNKDTGLGLNIMRYNIGGGDDPTHNHITRTDSEVPGYAANITGSADSDNLNWDYDWTADYNQRNVLKDCIEESGQEAIVEAFSNSPPYFMTNSGCSSGAVNASNNNLNDNCYDDFSKYLADVAAHFKDSWGITFQSMDAMNEPYTSYWGAYSNKQEGCHFDQGDSESNMITSLRSALNTNGLNNIMISGTDETSIDTQITSYHALSQAAKDTLERIDVHTYSGSKRAALKSLAESENKNLWMSEVDGGGTAGTNAGEMGAALWLSQRIITDVNGMTPSAWILWNIIDNHISSTGYNGNTDSGDINRESGYWGIAVADHDNQTVNLTMKYYAFGQFTKYIRPGYTIIPSTSNTLVAYDETGKQLVIVATNTSSSDLDYDFDLSQFSAIGDHVSVVRTSGSLADGEKWARLSPITTHNSGFYATLKANSVTTYIVQGVENDGSNITEIPLSSDMITGSTPYKNSTTNIVANVADGNTSTFFDGVVDGYVLIDLGEALYNLDAIGYAPREGYEYRCVDAAFYGSTDGENWTPITSITSKPSTGMNYIYSKYFTNNMPIRYLKYTVPSGVPNNGVNNDGAYNCNIAEIKLYGSSTMEIDISSNMVTGSTPYKNSTTNIVTNVVDGSTSTFFDGVVDGYVLIDLGEVRYSLDVIGYAPRAGYEYRCVDAAFYGSMDGKSWTPITTITNKPSTGMNYIYSKSFTKNTRIRFLKYTVPSGVPNNGVNKDGAYNCNIAEIKLYGHDS